MVISMDRWRGKVAVVTGASAGIGAAIVEHLVDAGLKVVGMARRVERVEALKEKLAGRNGTLYAVKVDVSVEEDVLKGFQWVRDNVGPVHILINNAGVVRSTGLMDGSTDEWRKVLDTNVLGLTICTREAIMQMRANAIDDGHIIHISSTCAHGVPPVPNMNVYPASKHAVKALTESLRQELNFNESKIKITSISPGYVATDIVVANDLMKNPVSMAFMQSFAATKPPNLLSEDVADAVVYALSTPPHVQIHEMIIKPVGERY